MPTYTFRHPNTGELFEEERACKDADQPFAAPDGVKCERVPWYLLDDAVAHAKQVGKWAKGLVDKKAEVWERDPEYVKSMRPKRVRTRDGRSIPYNPHTMS